MRCEVGLADVGLDLDELSDAGLLARAVEDEIAPEKVASDVDRRTEIEVARERAESAVGCDR
jgi:hypothetical protein